MGITHKWEEAPKTHSVRRGRGPKDPGCRGATGGCRLSRQLLVYGHGLQRGESMDNAFALAEHLSLTSCMASGSRYMSEQLCTESCESDVGVWTEAGF